jgi:endonuclease/exonuclease/phosphatase family metal-dependent hydrolase
MRIASFNVENLFQRPKAMNLGSWDEGKPVLAAHAELNTLLEEADYAGVAGRILELLDQLGVLRADEGTYVRLRKIRGQLLTRPRDTKKPVKVVAKGRADWIGWVELKTEIVDELAMQHTAMVIKDVNAEVMGVVEADNRPTLQMFTESMLKEVGGTPYDQVMLIDGNDARGIDVGLLARSEYPLLDIRSHVFDRDAKGEVFSRDCCEYHLGLNGKERLVVLVNHLKSKGYGSKDDPIGAKRRKRQATRIAQIYESLRGDGLSKIAVLGDFNDDPTSASLAPLLKGTDLKDISTHPRFDWAGRKGTFGGGGTKDKFDYVLLSPELFKKAVGGAVFRKGLWHGPRTGKPWEIYESLKEPEQAASDHAAIYADIQL